MELEREREREREKILQSIILNSTSVLPEAMKKEQEEEKGNMDKRLAKTRRGKGSISDHHRFH